MTTPYCSKDQWAKRKSSKIKSYADWDDYAAINTYPDANSLEDALEDATDIMNDEEHLGTLTTNITDPNYTKRLERICYDTTNHLLSVEQHQGYQIGKMFFSPQDFMFKIQRDTLIKIAVRGGYRVAFGVGRS